MTTQELNRMSQDEPGLLSHDALTITIAFLMERIRRLPKEDKQDLFELIKELPHAETREEYDSIEATMREILEQAPVRVRRMDQPSDEPAPTAGLRKWTDYISEKIRSARTEAGLTQIELAARSGLPQSHISRLENGQHSPSRATIEKIAKALGRPLSDFDPSASEFDPSA